MIQGGPEAEHDMTQEGTERLFMGANHKPFQKFGMFPKDVRMPLEVLKGL